MSDEIKTAVRVYAAKLLVEALHQAAQIVEEGFDDEPLPYDAQEDIKQISVLLWVALEKLRGEKFVMKDGAWVHHSEDSCQEK